MVIADSNHISDILGDAWRTNRADLAEHIFWVREYQRQIKMGLLVHYSLESRCRAYLASLHRAMDAEEKMIELGIEFTRTELPK